MTYNQWLFVIYACLIVVMSIAAFAAFSHDKKLAVKGAMRVKEKTLLQLAVLNGAAGAFIGRIVAHHKTDKVYFSITIYLALFLQAVVFIVLGLGALGVF